jgi:O-antigen/teichoic acid export membrane protein
LLAAFWPRLFASAEIPLPEVRSALVLMSLAIGFTLPMDLFAARLIGAQKAAFVNISDMATRLVNAAAVVLVLRSGGGLVQLAAVQLGCKLLLWAACLMACHGLFGATMSWNPRRFSWTVLRDVLDYSGKNMIANLARMVTQRTDLVITGMLQGVLAVTGFQVGRMLVDYAFAAISSITQPFVPYFTHLSAVGGRDEANRLYLKGTRLTAVLTGLMFVLGMSFGSPFLEVWLGRRFVEGDWLWRSDIVLWILLGAYTPRLVQNLSIQYLLAIRQQRFLIISSTAEAVVKLALCLTLGRWLGLVGIALGSFVPMVIVNGILLPRYMLRSSGLPAQRYWREALAGPVKATLLALPGCLLLSLWRRPNNWYWLIGEGALGVAFCGVLFAWLALEADERRTYLRLP